MRILTIIAAAFMVSTNAYAALYLEPYIGYEKGKIDGTANGGPFGQDLSGSQIGAKIGFDSLGFAAGVDVAQVSLSGKDTVETPPDNMDFKGMDMGVFAQFTFPVMVKVSASYILSSKLEDEDAGTTTEFKGKGFKFGVGFTGLPFISINLDMIRLSYEDISQNGTAVVNNDLSRETFMLSVSLPLSL